MKKTVIAFIVVGLIILSMSSIKIAIPIIISNSIMPSINSVVNVTPGMNLIITDINGSLRLIPIKGYSAFINFIDYLSPILILVGIIMTIALAATKKDMSINLSDPLSLGTLLTLVLSVIFALPIPTPIYITDGITINTSTYLLVGLNAYVGLASVMYLISTALLLASSWLYREPQVIEELYPDIDQLMSMTVILKSEEETEHSE